MSDHPCSCGSCTNLYFARFFKTPTCRGKPLTELEMRSYKSRGCLSHPLAREYLNKEVIEELEQKSKSLMVDAKKFRNILSLMMSEGVDIAIKLLKEGVKK